LTRRLDRLYDRLNRRQFVHPDPLEVLYGYEDAADREIAALVAASLAYGRVALILRSVRQVLDTLGPLPMGFLLSCTDGDLHDAFAGFRHRFTGGADIARLLIGTRDLVAAYGSLEAAFAVHLNARDETVLSALAGFVRDLTTGAGGPIPHLLPSPEGGSACKRLHLFLRWMVRRDAVDPGGWSAVRPAQLLVPVDVHMRRIGTALGLTRRKSADLGTAIEITNAFRSIAPHDPVRYDFALTRLGIRGDAPFEEFFPGGVSEEAAGE
jgi:uncharacterized protein (TIGR02757 family)